MVLLHGGYQDSRFWGRQLADLSDGFTVIALDAPGFGNSDDPPDTWTAADYGHCVAGFLDALGVHRPVVVGLSFGSVLALAVYEQHPDVVGSPSCTPELFTWPRSCEGTSGIAGAPPAACFAAATATGTSANAPKAAVTHRNGS